MGTNHRPLIERISKIDPPLFLFGGVAEDVLMSGDLDKPHGDVDLLVRRSSLTSAKDQCEQLGFGSLQIFYEPRAGLPLVLGSSDGTFDIELGVSDEEHGEHFFVAGDSQGRLFRVSLPSDVYEYPPTVIDGLTIHTISPLALYQMRAAFGSLRTFGDLRARDIEAQAQLLSTFLSDSEPDSWQPQLTELPGT